MIPAVIEERVGNQGQLLPGIGGSAFRNPACIRRIQSAVGKLHIHYNRKLQLFALGILAYFLCLDYRFFRGSRLGVPIHAPGHSGLCRLVHILFIGAILNHFKGILSGGSGTDKCIIRSGMLHLLPIDVSLPYGNVNSIESAVRRHLARLAHGVLRWESIRRKSRKDHDHHYDHSNSNSSRFHCSDKSSQHPLPFYPTSDFL